MRFSVSIRKQYSLFSSNVGASLFLSAHLAHFPEGGLVLSVKLTSLG